MKVYNTQRIFDEFHTEFSNLTFDFPSTINFNKKRIGEERKLWIDNPTNTSALGNLKGYLFEVYTLNLISNLATNSSNVDWWMGGIDFNNPRLRNRCNFTLTRNGALVIRREKSDYVEFDGIVSYKNQIFVLEMKLNLDNTSISGLRSRINKFRGLFDMKAMGVLFLPNDILLTNKFKVWEGIDFQVINIDRFYDFKNYFLNNFGQLNNKPSISSLSKYKVPWDIYDCKISFTQFENNLCMGFENAIINADKFWNEFLIHTNAIGKLAYATLNKDVVLTKFEHLVYPIRNYLERGIDVVVFLRFDRPRVSLELIVNLMEGSGKRKRKRRYIFTKDGITSSKLKYNDFSFYFHRTNSYARNPSKIINTEAELIKLIYRCELLSSHKVKST